MMIEQLIMALDAQFPEEQFKPVELEVAKTKFYVHFDEQTLQITTISANDTPVEGQRALEIDHEQGMKFMMGEENPINWNITYVDKTYSLCEIDRTPVKVSRVELGFGIYEVCENEWDDVRLVIDRENNCVDIHYDGMKIQNQTRPVKMYFTREGDMSYLKCAFSLDVNILDTILRENNLDEWPNPIRLKLDDVDDLSIFAVKGPITVSIQS